MPHFTLQFFVLGNAVLARLSHLTLFLQTHFLLPLYDKLGGIVGLANINFVY